MINFKKMDEVDFVFINQQINPDDEKAFSDFLKKRSENNINPKLIQTRKKSLRKNIAQFH
ncbi:MAG: hypothetical protein HW421_3324 [Ignavibacteria bacterium]|nr:hypothetical protein [Ignavibacteria bacterium]